MKKTRKKRRIRALEASFSIEAALVFPVVLLALALMIRAALLRHDMTVSGFTAAQAAELMTARETVWDERCPSEDTIREAGASQLNECSCGGDLGLSFFMTMDGIRAEAGNDLFTESAEIVRHDPERWMRASSVIEALTEKLFSTSEEQGEGAGEGS